MNTEIISIDEKGTELNLEEIIITEQQTDDMAFTIYQDIFQYIKEHTTEFIKWFIDESIKLANNLIMDSDNGIIDRPNYNYDICQYKMAS